MEVLLEVVAVHAELSSFFGNSSKDEKAPVKRGMSLVVDSVVIAFIQAHRIPDEYSQDGAWQLLVDLSFAEHVLEVFTSETSRDALREVIESANSMSSTNGGKSRRDDVRKKLQEIMRETTKATEYLWSGIRCRNS